MKKKNILVLTYWNFNSALIQTYTLPYVRQIKKQLSLDSKIFILTLSESFSATNPQTAAIITDLKEQNIYCINFSYKPFGWLMAVKLCYISIYLILFSFLKNIKYIHVWCTPAGAIGYIVSVFTGKTLILDSFEPHAETMVEVGAWKKQSPAFRLLFKFEKLQLERAKEVICAAEGMIAYSQNLYGVKKNRYFVKPACVDLELFKESLLEDSKTLKLSLPGIVCVYAGKFGDIYLEKDVFDFFKVAYDYWKGNFSVLLLTSHSDEEIQNYCLASRFPFSNLVKKFVNHNEVPLYMAKGNFGICPVKPIPSKRYCTPIKNGEYWAMGLPVVITKNISTDSDLIEKNDIGYVLKNLTNDEYLNAVKKIDELLCTKGLKNKIRAIAENHRNFKNSELIYRTIYV